MKKEYDLKLLVRQLATLFKMVEIQDLLEDCDNLEKRFYKVYSKLSKNNINEAVLVSELNEVFVDGCILDDCIDSLEDINELFAENMYKHRIARVIDAAVKMAHISDQIKKADSSYKMDFLGYRSKVNHDKHALEIASSGDPKLNEEFVKNAKPFFEEMNKVETVKVSEDIDLVNGAKKEDLDKLRVTEEYQEYIKGIKELNEAKEKFDEIRKSKPTDDNDWVGWTKHSVELRVALVDLRRAENAFEAKLKGLKEGADKALEGIVGEREEEESEARVAEGVEALKKFYQTVVSPEGDITDGNDSYKDKGTLKDVDERAETLNKALDDLELQEGELTRIYVVANGSRPTYLGGLDDVGDVTNEQVGSDARGMKMEIARLSGEAMAPCVTDIQNANTPDKLNEVEEKIKNNHLAHVRAVIASGDEKYCKLMFDAMQDLPFSSDVIRNPDAMQAEFERMVKERY